MVSTFSTLANCSSTLLIRNLTVSLSRITMSRSALVSLLTTQETAVAARVMTAAMAVTSGHVISATLVFLGFGNDLIDHCIFSFGNCARSLKPSFCLENDRRGKGLGAENAINQKRVAEGDEMHCLE